MAKLNLAAEFPAVTHADWVSQVEASIGSGGIDQLASKTGDDITVGPIYQTPQTAFPSLHHGPTPTGDPWIIVQRTDIPDIGSANKQILDDLLNGTTGIAMVVAGASTAGSYGLTVRETGDIKRLMNDVELDLISLRLDAGPGARQIALILLKVYQDRNLDLSRCQLTLGLDPVGNFALSGSSQKGAELGPKMAEIFHHSRELGHKGIVFSGNGRVYHEAGATQGQELGFTIASIVQQVRLLESAGVDVKSLWPQLNLMLSADADQFLTIAKLRAAHLVWQQLQEAMDLDPSPLSLDVETSSAMMSKRDPNVNMLRTTTAVFSAGVGGAASITCLPFTSAIGVADGFARRIARNSQIVLQEESSIGRVGDAAAGSGYVEAMTSQIAEKAWQILQDVERDGGMLEALCAGRVQKLITENAAKTALEVESQQRTLVGVNQFTSAEKTAVRTLDLKSVPVRKAPENPELSCDRLLQVRLAQSFESSKD